MPGAARLGDKAEGIDAHGCIACPHSVSGPIVQASPDVEVNGKPLARQGDTGIHKICCGPNIFYIRGGSDTVFCNGKPVARLNDGTPHCGGVGEIKEGSSNVIIGNGLGKAFEMAAQSHAPFVFEDWNGPMTIGPKTAEGFQKNLEAEEIHVGAGKNIGGGKNVVNPSSRTDNCTACVSSFMGSKAEKKWIGSADDIEAEFGYTGMEREFSRTKSIEYIQEVTGLTTGRPVGFMDKNAPLGHYAIFTKIKTPEGSLGHVVYGRVKENGKKYIIDPQNKVKYNTWDEMVEDLGPGVPYLFE